MASMGGTRCEQLDGTQQINTPTAQGDGSYYGKKSCMRQEGEGVPQGNAARKPVVVCLGDSLTEGAVTGDWVSQEQHLHPQAVFINAGTGGEVWCCRLIGRGQWEREGGGQGKERGVFKLKC